ncbi:MAG: hypothetical protein WAT74_00785 [Flavobacteriales bacterium]
MNCFTVAASDTLNQLMGGYIETQYFLQISSTGLSSNAKFNFCLRDSGEPFGDFFTAYGPPTPVLCFPYDLVISEASSASSLGGANLMLDEEYGPYAILWSDGVMGPASRVDLPIGAHNVSATSAAGCTELIPFEIAIDPSLGIDLPDGGRPRIVQGPNGACIDFGASLQRPSMIYILDAYGRHVASLAPTAALEPISGPFASGFHVAVLNYTDGSIARLKYAIIK